MSTTEKICDTGVLVGRFQVTELTEGHRYVIDESLKLCKDLIIVLGLAPVINTKRNPLDFQSRNAMIQEAYPKDKYPNIKICYINDHRDDHEWSKQLDTLIHKMRTKDGPVLLLGSRDSFIKCYTGKHTTKEIESTIYASGTNKRSIDASRFSPNMAFRLGSIGAAYARYDAVYPTVDVLVKTKDKKVLLVKKATESGYRFPGGFVQPSDESYEVAAARELEEETGLKVDPHHLGYVLSTRVNDWRYKREAEKILTTLYIITVDSVRPVHGADDVELAVWVDKEDVNTATYPLVEEHVPMWEKATTTNHIFFL